MTNKNIAQLLKEIAAAYIVENKNHFKIVAYQKAAEQIENYPSGIKDLWIQGKLSTIPGIGPAICGHLDELLRTGHVNHFDLVRKKMPKGMFELLKIPGFGPKRAFFLAKTFCKNEEKRAIEKIEKAARLGKIAQLPGYGEKLQNEILLNIKNYKKGALRKDQNRIPIIIADKIANEITTYLSKIKEAEKVTVLGSLRRRSPTIGDLDVAVATKKPDIVIKHFLSFPKINKVIEKGPTGASIVITNAIQIDLRVQSPKKYGAMLQYFTGNKNHNIKLREIAIKRGKSLSEHGIKKVQSSEFRIQSGKIKSKLREFSDEKEFYKALELAWIPPELREDRGEIKASLSNNLPELVKLSDIKGDLHIHSDYDLESSHDLGSSSVSELIEKARKLKYAYIGISDHNPSLRRHTGEQINTILKRRKEVFEKYKYSSKKSRVQLLIMMEIDILPDGKIALPEKAFDYLDAAIVSIHSSFKQSRLDMTKRIISGLSHEKVKILGHPTARLIGKREGINADWESIFNFCKRHDKAIEVNGSWQRLDLPDALVLQAKRQGVKFVINTDSHSAQSMSMMQYGVDVARRGWLEKSDVLNTMEYNEFVKWLRK